MGIFLCNLAKLVSPRDPAAAAPLAREALSILSAVQPPGRRAAEVESVLGEALAGLGRLAEAEPLLVDGYRQLAAAQGEGRRHARAALERPVALYGALHREDQAAPLRALLQQGAGRSPQEPATADPALRPAVAPHLPN